MSAVATAIVASSVMGGISANKAAKTQAGAADRSTAASQAQFDKNVQLQEPWRLAGEESLNYLTKGIKPGGEFARDFSLADFQADPGYAFRLSEGIKALDRTAASRGGLMSGAQLKGISDYGQNMASNEYTNAFNRYQVNRANRLNPLLSIAGLGQTSTNALTNAGTALGNTMGSNIMAAGNANASGYMGVANAVSGGLNTGLNYYQSQNMLDALRGGRTGTTGGYANSYGNFTAPDYNVTPSLSGTAGYV